MTNRKGLILFVCGLLAVACTSETAVPPPTNPPDKPTTPLLSNTPTTETAVRAATQKPAPEPTQPPTPILELAKPEERITKEPTPVSPQSDLPTPPPLTTTASVSDLTLAGSDGLPIQATYYQPAGVVPHPGVLLLHMLNSNRRAWAGFAQQLADSGYAVLAIDMRGHGDTGGERDWEKAAADHTHIWRQFVSRVAIDKENTAVIGGSIGANMALQLGTAQPMIKTAVLLSPGLDYRGVTTETAVQSYGNRPLLIVASEEDSYAANSSRSLLDLASPQAALQMYSGIGHGTSMLNNDPALTQTLLDWLQPILKASEM